LTAENELLMLWRANTGFTIITTNHHNGITLFLMPCYEWSSPDIADGWEKIRSP